jgi:hypothetical protein
VPGIDPKEISRLVELRGESERAEAIFKAAKAAHDGQQELVWGALEDMGVSSIKIDLPDGRQVGLTKRETIRSRIIDRETLIDALEQAGRTDEMVFTDIRKRQLNELIRECIEQGIPLPDGADFSSTKYITISGR